MCLEKHDKRLLKLAIRIHNDNLSNESHRHRVVLPDGLWRDCMSLGRKFGRALDRRFYLAADHLRRDLQSRIAFLRQNLQAVWTALDVEQPATFASPGDIYRDLLALRDEFDGLDWDIKERTLSVTTEPIFLDDVELGPFEVRLNWDHLNWPQPYETIALSPNPAAYNESVTHPHVQDRDLCEGEGRVSINRALKEGRLLDFFLIVRGILTTYNDANAYVPISRWSGAYCEDCDDFVPSEDTSSCIRCERVVCDDCCSVCSACDETICDRCLTECSDCGERACSSCLQECENCSTAVCRLCVNNSRCSECHENHQQQTSNEEVDDGSDASVQPVVVGQAGLST